MPERITSSLARESVEELSRGFPVDHSLQPWGRLRVERLLPFLCVYRRPVGIWDHGTADLVTPQPSYLLAPGDARSSGPVLELVAHLSRAMSRSFGNHLLVEIWCARDHGDGVGEGERTDPRSTRPSFRVMAPTGDPDALGPARFLVEALSTIRAEGREARADLVRMDDAAPPGMRSLSVDAAMPVTPLGLEVGPVFRELDTGELFPFLLDELRRELAPVLGRTVERFTECCADVEPMPIPRLSRTALEPAAAEVDRRLSTLAGRYDLLLEVTPVNTRECWEAFRRSGFEESPDFQYRALRFHPAALKRDLFSLPVDEVDEPLLARLFREKQEEVDRHLTMLLDRGTRDFFHTSLQVYGEVDDDLLELAETILERIPPPAEEPPREGRVLGDEEIAEAAQSHLDGYRETCPAFPLGADIRDDLPPGLLVSRGRLLIGRGTRISRGRVEALMHHEIGTHMVTHYNGAEQPLQLLRVGLAGYEPLQEALAVLAEYLAGGLTAGRLRMLAARVVAVRALIEGADFVEVHRLLTTEHGYAPRSAFTVTMRVQRGGGMTKDLVYLQGLAGLARAIREGVELEPLFLGKISLHRVSDVEDLLARGMLDGPRIRPAHLEMERSGTYLERLRSGLSLVDLLRRNGGAEPVHERRPR